MEADTPKGKVNLNSTIDGKEFKFNNIHKVEIKATAKYSDDNARIIQTNIDPKGVEATQERYMEGEEMHLKITKNGATMTRKFTKAKELRDFSSLLLEALARKCKTKKARLPLSSPFCFCDFSRLSPTGFSPLFSFSCIIPLSPHTIVHTHR